MWGGIDDLHVQPIPVPLIPLVPDAKVDEVLTLLQKNATQPVLNPSSQPVVGTFRFIAVVIIMPSQPGLQPTVKPVKKTKKKCHGVGLPPPAAAIALDHR